MHINMPVNRNLAIKTLILCLVLSVFSVHSTAYAADVVSVKTIGLDLARDIASESLIACRKKGYQVSAVVVDRNGLLQAALRDDVASRFTLQIAEEKANAVILYGGKSGDLRESLANIRPELNHINGIIVMQGGIPIKIAGSNVGAVGVSGAPGGDKDEWCAEQALKKLSERIEFAE